MSQGKFCCHFLVGKTALPTFQDQFHGHQPGRKKREKALARFQEEMKMRNMEMGDTPLKVCTLRVGSDICHPVTFNCADGFEAAERAGKGSSAVCSAQYERAETWDGN